MAAKKVTRADEEFIARHRADMSVRELAGELKLSKTTVQRVLRRVGDCAEPKTAVQARASAVKVAESDELVLLVALAEQLWFRIGTASDKEVARLSAEYRETLRRVTELQAPAGGDAPQGEPDLFEAIAAQAT